MLQKQEHFIFILRKEIINSTSFPHNKPNSCIIQVWINVIRQEDNFSCHNYQLGTDWTLHLFENTHF